MPQAQITLAPSNGIVIVSIGTTNAFVAEELLGRKIDKEKFANRRVDRTEKPHFYILRKAY